MASKVPQKVFMEAFLSKLEADQKEWSTKKSEQGDIVLDTTTHNTAIVMRALREAAHKAGYISLMFALGCCKTDNLE